MQLRIPDIHGAKNTKNQTPLAYFASLLGIIIEVERIEKPVCKNGPFLNLTQLDRNDIPRILLNCTFCEIIGAKIFITKV